jgi:hypothetical protein
MAAMNGCARSRNDGAISSTYLARAMQYFREHSEVFAMLPQIKRPQHDDGEVEIEVVDVRNVDGSNVSDDDPTMLASNAALKKELAKGGAHPSARASHSTSSAPSHLKKGVFGDEPTQLMPVKKNAAALMPQPDRPASQRPNSGRPGSAMSSSLPEARSPGRASSRAPSPNSERPRAALDAAMPRIPMHAPPPSFNMRDREDSHTSLRPMSGLSEEAQKVLAESKAAAASMAVPSAGAIKAQVDAARAKRLSDQRARAAETLEVTPVSISERFVVQGRPAAPWAIAFVAMGIFAGITTVVFTGGRASAIAAFIDPAHEAPAVMAAPATVAAAAPLANDPAANLLPGAMAGTQANPQAVTGAPVDIAPMTPTVFAVGRASNTQTAQPQVAAAPVQVAAPTPHATPKPQADPTPAPRPAPVAVSKPDPKPAPAPVVAAADPKPAAADTSKPSSHHSSSSSKKPAGGGGDVDSAAAADALAKAQLENSL